MIDVIDSIVQNTLALTVIFIILSTVVAAFVKGRKRDKCLMDFRDNMVTLQKTDGKSVYGKLAVENTGLELVYVQKHEDEDGHFEASYILYKYEFGNIEALIRYHDELSEENKRQRIEALEKTYHPNFVRRFGRRIQNVFKTIRDSLMDVVNMFLSKAKAGGVAGGALSSQDKYVSQMKKELMGSVGTSFEPLLEKYIGHIVVLEMIKGDEVIELVGVLREYTAEFVELMDVDYKADEGSAVRKADVVIGRKVGIVRHLGE
jgi:hypothetical protein